MILQKTTLAKLATRDGEFDYSTKGVPVGQEIWVEPGSTTMKAYRIRGTSIEHSKPMVRITEIGIWIPVELLHYTDDWRVQQ